MKRERLRVFKVKMLRWAAEKELNWRQAAAITAQLAWRNYCNREAMQHDELYKLIRGKRASELQRRKSTASFSGLGSALPGALQGRLPDPPGTSGTAIATIREGPLVADGVPAEQQGGGGGAALERMAAALEQTVMRLERLEKKQELMQVTLTQQLGLGA